MKPTFDIILVMPIGPSSSCEFISDSISSFIYYTRSGYKIILADDSHQGIGAEVAATIPGCDVIVSKNRLGGWAGLYINLSLAFSHAVQHYRFKALLKLDTDALVIGPAPEKEALELITANPKMGIAGQYPNDYFGNPWDIEWPRRRILNGTRTWKFLRRPFANWTLIKLYSMALKNGYRTGESVFGGAYFMSESFLIQLHASRLLPLKKFRSLNLGEDHLFSLLAKATGFELGSLSAKGMPFGCAWKGLPVSPEELAGDNKKIIHSVRYWNNMTEKDIRAYFSAKRKPLLQVAAGAINNVQ